MFGRADHNYDPVPDGERIEYLPLSEVATNTLWIGGVDFELDQSRVLPATRGDRGLRDAGQWSGAESDVVVKATVFVTW